MKTIRVVDIETNKCGSGSIKTQRHKNLNPQD